MDNRASGGVINHVGHGMANMFERINIGNIGVKANKQLCTGDATAQSRCVRVNGVGSDRLPTTDNIEGRIDSLVCTFYKSTNS